MKPDHLHNPVSRSAEDPDEMTMTIDRDSIAHVMHLLRNNLYRDKIGSPVREYASNAADAHTEAGIPGVPIRIHLPHDMDPYFRVADQGAGLTEGEMDRIFRRFGRSTKRESNDTIGCLGIGAKSAFAYTDSFMVTSHTVRGTSRSTVRYSVYLDESRLGKITVLDRKENPENLTGLTVEIPVRPDDFYTFQEAVAAQLRFFQPAPECFRDGKAVELGWKEPTFLCPDFELDDNRARVIMGGVQYAIEADHLRKPQANLHGEISAVATARSKGQKLVLELKLIIRVPIGAVDVDASREGLSYTEKTQRTIAAHCRLAYRRLNRAIEAELQSLPTRACAIYEARSIDAKYKLSGDQRLALSWHGQVLPTEHVDLAFNDSRYGKARRLEFQFAGKDFDFAWQLPVVYDRTRKPVAGERYFVPVLQDVVSRPGQGKIAERMHTLEKQHPGAQLICYRMPKRLPEDAPEGLATELYYRFLKMVLRRAFRIPTDELEPGGTPLTLQQLLDLWAALGGIRLQDVVPTVGAVTRLVGSKTRYVKKPLDCTVLSVGEQRLRHTDLPAFLMTPAMQQPVVYWIVSSLGKPRLGYESTDYRLVTRRYEPFRLQPTLSRLETTYGVRCLLLELDLNKQTELSIPAGWTPGQTWLADKLQQAPEIVRYYWHKQCGSSLLERIERTHRYLPTEFQELLRCRWLLNDETQQALKFLLVPTLQKCFQTIDRTEQLPEYQTLRKAVQNLVLAPPVVRTDPLADYPLLADVGLSHALAYVQLVHRVGQLEAEIEQLKASQIVLPPTATPSHETEIDTETQLLQTEDQALALAQG